jgi:hypothetical protein
MAVTSGEAGEAVAETCVGILLKLLELLLFLLSWSAVDCLSTENKLN